MKGHLVIFSPIVHWAVHFETDLEIAQRYLDEGWDVSFLHCNGKLPACAQNITHIPSICRKCISRFNKGIRWLNNDKVKIIDFYEITVSQHAYINSISEATFTSIDEIKAFMIDSAKIGNAVVGSIISYLREPKPDLTKHLALFKTYLKSAMISYFSILNRLSALAPNMFVIFNGRFAELRCALFASRSLNILTYVHERAGVLDRYSLTCNGTPNDIKIIKQEIDDVFSEFSSNVDEKTKIAYEWYDERRENRAQSWYSFTAKQKPDVLPDLAFDRLNIVIFNSSEDEVESYDEWKNPFYSDQNEAIDRIISDLENDFRYKLFLRVHPNLRGIKNSQTEDLGVIHKKHPKLTVISADSFVSSYGLLKSADIIIVFGSTIGIEAVYIGKPCFLMGRALYEDLGGCVVPQNHEELIKLLDLYAGGDRSMLPEEDSKLLAVVKFGYFQKLWGHTYKYVQPYNVGKSVMIKNGRKSRLLPSIYSWSLHKAAMLLQKLRIL